MTTNNPLVKKYACNKSSEENSCPGPAAVRMGQVALSEPFDLILRWQIEGKKQIMDWTWKQINFEKLFASYKMHSCYINGPSMAVFFWANLIHRELTTYEVWTRNSTVILGCTIRVLEGGIETPYLHSFLNYQDFSEAAKPVWRRTCSCWSRLAQSRRGATCCDNLLWQLVVTTCDVSDWSTPVDPNSCFLFRILDTFWHLLQSSHGLVDIHC